MPLQHAAEQRTDEWYALRLGKPTASQFGRIISRRETKAGYSYGLKKETSHLYLAELVGERIFGRRMQKDISHYAAPKHGIETEPKSANILAQELGVDLRQTGFMTDDDNKYGASPDRVILEGNRAELVEIKCPYEIPQHLKRLVYGIDDNDYAQVQGQLLVSGYSGVHFYSYREDCPPYYTVIPRDEGYIAALRRILEEFCAEIDAAEFRLRAMHGWEV